MPKINYNFKCLTAIGSLLVISGHYGSIFLSVCNLFPYDTFHMALFVFISGYFYKNDAHLSFNDVKTFVCRKVKHLLIPYYIWNFFYSFVAILIHILFSSQVGINDKCYLFRLFIEPFHMGYGFGWNVAAWFMPALFLVEVIDCIFKWILSKLKNDLHYYVTIIYFLLFCLANSVVDSQFFSVEWCAVLKRTPYLLLWYAFGNTYHLFFEKIEKRISPIYIIFACMVTSLTLQRYFGNYVPIVYTGTFDGRVWYILLRTAIGILFWLEISRILGRITERSRCILYLSNHSCALMIHQATVGFFLNLCILKIPGIIPRYPGKDFFLRNVWCSVLPPQFRIVYVILIPIIICTIYALLESIVKALKITKWKML